MSTQNSITIVHHRNRPLPPSPAQAASTGRCHQRQAQAAALRNLPLRSIPSLATAFTPGLRSIPSLAPALHAVSSRHPFTWPWAAMGFARAQPAACLVNHSTNSSIGTSESIPVDGTGGWQSPYLPGVGQPFPDVTRPEQNQRERLFFFLTLHVRKTGKCHRGAWKAGWQFPDVTRPEQNQRRRSIFILTLHVRKTGSSETGKGSGKTRSGVSQRVRNSVVWGHGIELFQNVW